jgi:hypothetical protein
MYILSFSAADSRLPFRSFCEKEKTKEKLPICMFIVSAYHGNGALHFNVSKGSIKWSSVANVIQKAMKSGFTRNVKQHVFSYLYSYLHFSNQNIKTYKR